MPQPADPLRLFNPGSLPASPPHTSGPLEGPLASAPADDIRELTGVESLPSALDEFPGEEVAIGLGVALLLALLVYYIRRRRRPRPPEALEVAARRRLAALAALDSPDPRTFHAELAQILKEYCETTLSLGASRLTSCEMVAAFRVNGHMSEEWQAKLEGLLSRCDRAKFCCEWDSDWDPRELVTECRAVFDALAMAVAAAPRLASPWERWDKERGS